MAEAKRDQNFVPTLLGVSNADGITPVVLWADPVTHRLLVDAAGGGTGTVTSVSVVTANGFAGTVATATTTPAITLTTTVTGIIKGNGTAISAATAGTDYTALAFKTISVAGQSDIVADSAADTLTIAAGTNITLTTNAGTDTLTITASGGGSSDITIGTTTITSGTDTRILYDNAGVVGEYTLTGTGTVVAMGTAPVFVTNITTPAVLATANDSGALGASGTAFSDLFLAEGGVINWDAGDATITQTNNVIAVAGITDLTVSGNITPAANDGGALGSATVSFSDLFLASGAVINIANGNWVATHTSAILTIGTGTLKITTPTNTSTSVVTIDGTQTLTNKSIVASQLTGQVALANGGTAANLSDPGANTLLGWDDTDNAVSFFTIGTGLAYDHSTHTLSASGSSTPTMFFASIFETSGRFVQANDGVIGAATFNTDGIYTRANGGGAAAGYQSVKVVFPTTNAKLFGGSPTWTFNFVVSSFGTTQTDGSAFLGIGAVTVSSAGHTFTNDHIGFKITKSANTTTNLYATQADGSETASSALTTLSASDEIELILVVNGTSSVDYYWRKNGGALSSATNLTTHLPTSDTDTLQVSVSDDNNISATAAIIQVAVSYKR